MITRNVTLQQWAEQWKPAQAHDGEFDFTYYLEPPEEHPGLRPVPEGASPITLVFHIPQRSRPLFGPTVDNVDEVANLVWPITFEQRPIVRGNKPEKPNMTDEEIERSFDYFVSKMGNPDVIRRPYFTDAGYWRARIRFNGSSIGVNSKNGTSWSNSHSEATLEDIARSDKTLKSPKDARIKDHAYQRAMNGFVFGVDSVHLTEDEMAVARAEYIKRYGPFDKWGIDVFKRMEDWTEEEHEKRMARFNPNYHRTNL